jgi:ankyrin repeat protein
MYNNQNNVNITNLLISSGSNLNYQNKNGYSALMIGEFNFQFKIFFLNFSSISAASKLGFVEIATALIRAGANLELGDANGQSALIGG